MKTIAKRVLFYSEKGSHIRNKFIIRIGFPYVADENVVDFTIGEEDVFGCHIETEGLENEYQDDVYGVDGIQAVNMASNIEPFLMRLQKKYDLYWQSGEGYFDD